MPRSLRKPSGCMRHLGGKACFGSESKELAIPKTKIFMTLRRGNYLRGIGGERKGSTLARENLRRTYPNDVPHGGARPGEPALRSPLQGSHPTHWFPAVNPLPEPRTPALAPHGPGRLGCRNSPGLYSYPRQREHAPSLGSPADQKAYV